jgi:hypothetical protein
MKLLIEQARLPVRGIAKEKSVPENQPNESMNRSPLSPAQFGQSYSPLSRFAGGGLRSPSDE